MVSFIIYDLIFLVLFTLGVFLFLRTRREELSREGWIFMWRTQFGVKAISWFTGKFDFIMRKIKWIIIGIGGILMGTMIWMLGQTVAIYLLHPEITKLIKAPPIAPLIPYFPKLFGMESLFPPFYFTYFIVALAIVAIAHEFSHGIFMKLFRVKIKSTGLVFLGPILGAFVEEEKTGFHKKKNSEQMTVLAAGVFANVLIALLFYLFYVAFFFSSFSASGYLFNSYAGGNVMAANIDGLGEDVGEMYVMINGQSAILNMSKAYINNTEYLISTDVKNTFAESIDLENAVTTIFLNAPAISNGMRGAIIQIDDVKILGQETLRLFLENKNPGNIVKVVTEDADGTHEYNIVLGEHPTEEGRAYLGIGYSYAEPKGVVQKLLAKFMSFKDSSAYYIPTWDGEFVYFFYHLLWWIMIINLLVALFNMLPLGMLDGGRFFYLTVLSIFKSERVAKGAYKMMTYLILGMFALMMIFWFVRII